MATFRLVYAKSPNQKTESTATVAVVPTHVKYFRHRRDVAKNVHEMGPNEDVRILAAGVFCFMSN